MTNFVLVPGAGGSRWYWHRLVDELQRRGHDVVAVELAGGDSAAGLVEYADTIAGAARTLAEPVVVVAQSLGGFSAPVACTELVVQRLVLVNAMIPAPGETAGQWWDDVGWFAAAQACAERDGRPTPAVTDVDTLFLHDVPQDLADIMRSDPAAAAEGPTIFSQPWPLAAWPDIPTVALAGRDDRLFPVAFQTRVARERLGIPVQVVPGGHLLALSQPRLLCDALLQ